MTSSGKLLLAAALLSGGLFAAGAVLAHPDAATTDSMSGEHSGGMMTGDSMMEHGSGGMMGMMQEMSRMMENCNEMMESKTHGDHAPEGAGKSGG